MKQTKVITRKPLLLSSLTLAITLTGCATTTPPPENDPWLGWNQGAHSFNDHIDKGRSCLSNRRVTCRVLKYV